MMYYRTIQQFAHTLKQLDHLLGRCQALAAEKGCDPADLLQARLAPDMFHFTRQIQIGCDNAKFAASRLSGKDAPKDADEEATIEELQARVQRTVAYLESFQEEDFDGASERRITLHFMPGVYLTGDDYLVQFVMPNFYFHATTAYNLLRQAGAQIGKRDFLGAINLRPLEG